MSDVARRTPSSVSVVSPVFNEEAGLAGFVGRTTAVLDVYEEWELILVDDGSTDSTRRVIRSLAATDPRIRMVGLARNFGQPVATSCGLAHSTGEVTAMLDSDLQDPPEVIVEMIDEWRRGAEVVLAIRRSRSGESRFKLLSARLFYRAFSRITGLSMAENAGDFRLLGRPALDAFIAMPERGRFVRGMTSWIGFPQAEVHYDRDARPAGSSNYSKRRLARMGFDAIVGFSHLPLRIATVLGFLVSMIAFLMALTFLLLRLFGHYIEGLSTTNIAISLFAGVQLVFLGVIGEYLAKIYDEVKQRPLFVVDERIGYAEGVAPTEVAAPAVQGAAP